MHLRRTAAGVIKLVSHGYLYGDTRYVEVTRLRGILFDTSTGVCSITMSSGLSSVWVDTGATEEGWDRKRGEEEEGKKEREGPHRISKQQQQDILCTLIILAKKKVITHNEHFSIVSNFNTAQVNSIKACFCLQIISLLGIHGYIYVTPS